jgi:hypothetical protein
MGPKYEHFKFELGQFVQLKIHDGMGSARKCQVIERLVQECPGGVQLHYKCRMGTNAVVNDCLEIELEEYCEKDWSQSIEELVKARAARKENRAWRASQSEPIPEELKEQLSAFDNLTLPPVDNSTNSNCEDDEGVEGF